MPITTEKRKYLELADHLRERIHSGELKVGERLPSYTELYERMGASTATVQRACDLLDQEQLIERRHGSGIFVAARQRNLSGTIGLIGSAAFKLLDGPFYVRLMNAVHRALESEQQHLLYLGKDSGWEASAAEKVDGLLMCGLEETSEILDKLPPHLPRVSVLTSMEGTTSICVDEYRGAQIATRYLMEQGHRRIACLMEMQAWQARRRVAGYSDVLQEYGIEAEPGWKRMVGSICRDDTGQPYVAWALEHMRAWLQDGWKETGCTAILVQNDAAAIGVIQVLQKEGIRVPEDVSVMGFDGTDICDLISPRLSSIVQPLSQIGAKAVEILNRQIAGEPSSAETILLPLSLHHGESVAPVASNPVFLPARETYKPR